MTSRKPRHLPLPSINLKSLFFFPGTTYQYIVDGDKQTEQTIQSKAKEVIRKIIIKRRDGIRITMTAGQHYSTIKATILVCCGLVGVTDSFQVAVPPQQHHRLLPSPSLPSRLYNSPSDDQIVSPFDNSSEVSSGDSSTTSSTATLDGPLDLTWDNVELVLDGMRSYLIQDGGNVAIQEIDGPVVKLELQGACGTCPSSTQTMKMGLERGLRERIPEIQEVIQAMPEGPELNDDEVNVILDGVRPFLQVAGGSINLDRFEGIDGLQPAIWLKMEGSSASLNSVKLEIAQRLQRHFMVAGLRVEWVE